MNKAIFSWFLVFIWAGVIFFLSSLPIIQDDSFETLDFIVKKSAHVIEYAVLFLLLSNALKPSQKRFQNAFIIGLLYAFSDEIHQLFTPGRGGSLRDVLLFDNLGLILGWLATKRFFNK
jgi:VanZ family protein